MTDRGVFVRRRATVGVAFALLVLLVWRVLPGDDAPSGPGALPTTSSLVPRSASGFERAAAERASAQGLRWEEVCDRSDPVDDQLLRAYGAVLVAPTNVSVPPTCRFRSAAEASAFQAGLVVRSAEVGGVEVRLQAAALDALLAAVADVRSAGGRITPRDDDASARTYEEGVALWTDRVVSGLDHWRRAGRLTRDEADRIAGLSPEDQIAEVLALEAVGLRFGTDQDGPILGSVAAPGSSQHLSLLAFDVAEDTDPAVTEALAEHGWHRTARGDRPHVAFLGWPAADLPAHGLRSEVVDGVEYWLPDL